MTETNQHCDSTLLQRYRDRDLDPAAAKSFEQHLRSCKQCERELQELDRLTEEARRMVAKGSSRMDRYAVSSAVMRAVHGV